MNAYLIYGAVLDPAALPFGRAGSFWTFEEWLSTLLGAQESYEYLAWVRGTQSPSPIGVSTDGRTIRGGGDITPITHWPAGYWTSRFGELLGGAGFAQLGLDNPVAVVYRGEWRVVCRDGDVVSVPEPPLWSAEPIRALAVRLGQPRANIGWLVIGEDA